jgi:hypothetical protein
VAASQPSYVYALGPPRSARRDLAARAPGAGLLALALYLALAIGLVGRPALSHFGAGTLGTGPDVQIFLWGLRWWPYAIGHGLDPLRSTLIWPPAGGQLLWTTTVPLLSLLMTPVTLTLGAQVSWNVLVVIAPATAAWSAWRLCTELDVTPGAALLGGGLFGFGSYELAQDIAHVQLTACALVPLAALVAVRAVRRVWSPSAVVCATAGLVVAQFLICPEILATMLVMSVAAALGALWLLRDERPDVGATIVAMGFGALIGVSLVSPLLAVMLAHRPAHSSGAVGWQADLLNLVVPTRRQAVGGAAAASVARNFPGNLAEQGAYLGLPIALVVLAWGWRTRRESVTRLLLALLAVSVVLSLGSRLSVDGGRSIWLPWAALSHLPLLRNALPVRLSLYSSLLSSVIVARWMSDPRGARWIRAVAVVAIVASLVPADWPWQAQPPAVRSAAVDRTLRSQRVLSLPRMDVGDRGLQVQEADDFRFSLLDGWSQVRPRGLDPWVGGPQLTAAGLQRLRGAGAARLRGELKAAHITRLLVWGRPPRGLAALGATAIRAGGVTVYRVR